MSKRKTDFRSLKARREGAMARPELRGANQTTVLVDDAAIEEAIKAGRYTKLPAQKRGRK
ncbi:hypothetical protein [Mesorhizobium neociceri]|uniref:Uncharacterized protein n=1 Tax=Mesorhizobium neociceri TaxID=1307853 RepID=A0A838B508_9HYPH|nr:hypothetical protein [Mesorhizobium neociceri]MBA1141706.1 hypothetical protein [Mesorhizobium neociceri]